MVYVACQYVGGDARVVDAEELAEVAWATLDEIETYVPYGVYPPVQEYLSRVLSSWPRRSA